MNCRKSLLLVGVIASFLLPPSNSHGQIQLPFRKKSEKSTSLNLTQSHGPWLVMVASFRGEEGQAEAKRLALELRQNRLDSYIFTKTFEWDEMVEGNDWEAVKQGEDQYQLRRKRMKHLNSSVTETAVMVGDFPNVEDKRAQRVLNAIKEYQPENPNEYESQNLRRWREFSRLLAKDAETLRKGPYGSAFLMLNPLLPDAYFDNQQVDDFVANKLNGRVRYSLLDNPHPYSVRVATFRGGRTLQVENQSNGGLFQRDKGETKAGGKLALAAAKAHKLTMELRKLGVDAYEFHDRSESYVCVGGFDWVKDGEGTNETFNPSIAKVIQKFKGRLAEVPSMKNAIQPKQLPGLKGTDIVFDIQPVPVKVPRRPSTMVKSRGWR